MKISRSFVVGTHVVIIAFVAISLMAERVAEGIFVLRIRLPLATGWRSVPRGCWYTVGSVLASTGARGVCLASVCDPPPTRARNSPRPCGRRGTSSRTRAPRMTTTTEARPPGSRSSRPRRGTRGWSRSCAGFARSSGRGARTSRSCAGWARAGRGRRRWLRDRGGGAWVRCEKTSSVSRQSNGAFPGNARGKRSASRVAGDAPPPEGFGVETIVPIARDAGTVPSASTSPSRVSRRRTRRGKCGPPPRAAWRNCGSSFPAARLGAHPGSRQHG